MGVKNRALHQSIGKNPLEQEKQKKSAANASRASLVAPGRGTPSTQMLENERRRSDRFIR